MASLSDTRINRKISCQEYINVWHSMMSGHSANPIFFSKKIKNTRYPPTPDNISFIFSLTPTSLKVDVICVSPLTLFPRAFSYNLKTDTREPVIDFTFNNRILILILMGYTHGPSVWKQIIWNKSWVFNLNLNSHWKIVLNLS